MPSFRLLYHQLTEHINRGHPAVYPTVLLPWVAQAQEAMAILAPYGTLEMLS